MNGPQPAPTPLCPAKPTAANDIGPVEEEDRAQYHCNDLRSAESAETIESLHRRPGTCIKSGQSRLRSVTNSKQARESRYTKSRNCIREHVARSRSLDGSAAQILQLGGILFHCRHKWSNQNPPQSQHTGNEQGYDPVVARYFLLRPLQMKSSSLAVAGKCPECSASEKRSSDCTASFSLSDSSVEAEPGSRRKRSQKEANGTPRSLQPKKSVKVIHRCSNFRLRAEGLLYVT